MYVNRDLSWLTFNYRVLQEAADDAVPLYERLKFLAIFSSNMDEFFRVRYPLVMALSRLGSKTRSKIDDELNHELSERIQAETERQLQVFGSILNEQLLPALAAEQVILYYNQPIEPEHQAELRELFLAQVLSFLQPILIDGESRFDILPENNKLYLLVSLRAPGSEMLQHSIVNIPSDQLPRFFTLQPLNGKNYVVFIDDIIREHIGFLFPRFDITGVYSIKLNRDADLRLEDEYSGDLLRRIEKQLHKRDFGPPSRFLYEAGMPRNVRMFLASAFGIQTGDMFAGGRYHNLRDLMSFPSFRPGLTYESRKPLAAVPLTGSGNIFKLLKERDVLIHLPYQSYNPILAFFNQAAVDPEVEEIYIALYRVASNSLIANALISAARNGKQVTAFMELKARFDEANNISWSRRMEEAGIRIVYSIPNIKVHAKIALVVRRGDPGRKSFAIFSTGNFNEQTARLYTDHSLMTTDRALTSELHSLFQFLVKRRQPAPEDQLGFERLLVSQFNMIARYEVLIKEQIKLASSGKPACIRIKVNNLEEPEMINRLYEASQAGVRVELLVRGICCLKPGLPGLSERIEVRRIVDRYLEHTRIFMFGEEPDQRTILMGSADWMTRNLRHRIEVCVPITDESCREQLMRYFELQWQDTDKAVSLNADMEMVPVRAADGSRFNAQSAIYKTLNQNL